jgi:hypothetical protein
MKKQAKKLVLAKETVRDLSRTELDNAVGGTSSSNCYYTVTCWSSPDYTCQQDFNPAGSYGGC